MTELSRVEQETGASRIRAWAPEGRRAVIRLPARERDTIVLLAALLDITPSEPTRKEEP